MMCAAGMGFGQVRFAGTSVMQRMLNVEPGRACLRHCKTRKRYTQKPNPRILHPAIPPQL